MPSSAATLAALRPLLRHNSSASFLYSSVYLALLQDGSLNCVFMWASFRVLTLCPLSVKSMQSYSDPFHHLPLMNGILIYVKLRRKTACDSLQVFRERLTMTSYLVE